MAVKSVSGHMDALFTFLGQFRSCLFTVQSQMDPAVSFVLFIIDLLKMSVYDFTIGSVAVQTVVSSVSLCL